MKCSTLVEQQMGVIVSKETVCSAGGKEDSDEGLKLKSVDL